MSIKMMLDEAAAEATAGLRIDLLSAQRQASERRALVRHRASASMAAAVARVGQIGTAVEAGAMRREVERIICGSLDMAASMKSRILMAINVCGCSGLPERTLAHALVVMTRERVPCRSQIQLERTRTTRCVQAAA